METRGTSYVFYKIVYRLILEIATRKDLILKYSVKHKTIYLILLIGTY